MGTESASATKDAWKRSPIELRFFGSFEDEEPVVKKFLDGRIKSYTSDKETIEMRWLVPPKTFLIMKK